MSKDRTPERTGERFDGIQGIGPQHIPNELKDSNYHYRWVNYDPERPFKFQSKRALGYDFIPLSEFENIREMMPNDPMFGGTGMDGTKICRKGSRGTVDYLLRIPIKRYLEVQAAKLKKAKEPLQQIRKEAEGTRPGYGGLDETSGPLGFN